LLFQPGLHQVSGNEQGICVIVGAFVLGMFGSVVATCRIRGMGTLHMNGNFGVKLWEIMQEYCIEKPFVPVYLSYHNTSQVYQFKP
jgi:hypothetical protein